MSKNYFAKSTYIRTFLLATLVFGISFMKTFGAVGVTAPSLTISTCSFPSAYIPLGNIVITEGAVTDFAGSGGSKTLVLNAPANFQFQAGTGAVNFIVGRDISAASVVVAATTITVTYTCPTNTKFDVLTISGIYVQAITGVAAGQTVTRSAASSGTIAGDVTGTVHATLTSVVGCATVTAPSLTISTCSFPSAYIPLGNIVITETANTDFSAGANQTLILTAPANFQFQAGTGAVSFTAAKDITAASVVVTATTITVTYTAGGVVNADALTISGLYVQAITGVAAGQTVTRTGGSGVINGDVNTKVHATLTSVVGCASVTAPSLTINTCSFPSAYSALGNIVISETANSDFSAGANQTLILTAPANFQFQAAIGSVTFAGGGDITAASVVVTATTITVTYSVGGVVNPDALTISGIMVQGITGAAAGQTVTRTGGSGVINGDVNTKVHATLTSTLATCATITAPSLTISTCSFPSAYIPLGNIVITEGSNANFSAGAGQTLILTAPANFQFQAGVGTVSFTAGKDITAASIVVTATTITITYSVGGVANGDAMTISGIYVQAITGAAAGQTVTRTGGTGVIAGDVNTTVHATLTSVVGCVVTAPSLTITTCSFPSTYTALGNIVITEGAVTDFSAGANQTLILTAPTNFQFQANTGFVTYTGGRNITGAAITVTATTITITYTVTGTNALDVMTISGIYVQAITGAAAGQVVMRTGGTGVINGDINTTVHATLTSTLSTVPGSCATYTAPANGSSGVSVNGTILTWNAVAGATGYDVYLQAGATPPTILVSSNQAATSYSTGALTGSATYYWIIVPRNSCGTAAGCNTVWSFSTASSGCVTWTSQADFGFGITTDNIDLTTSPNNIVLQTNQTQVADQANTGAVTSGYGVTATQWIGQTFTPSITGKLTAVDIGFFTNTTGGTCLVQVYITAGGVPTGASIATTTLQYFGGTALYNCTFTTPACLTAGTLYAIVCTAPITGTQGNFSACNTPCNTYANGTMIYSLNAGGSWSTFTSDCVFRTYMSTYAYSSQGTWTSPIINSGASADWTTLGWNAVVPANTTVQYQVWAGNSTTGPFLYVGPNGTSATYFTLAGSGNPSLLDANVPGPNSPPYSYTYGKQYLRVKAYLNTTVTGPVGCNPGTTPTINDITVCYNIVTCPAPTTQATNITFSNIAASQMLVNWTNGNGAKRILKIRRQSDPAFTFPVDGVDPVANTVYSGAGEQVVYNGAGNGVTVTGLAAYDGTPNTVYCFEVWEANCVGTSVKWYFGAGIGNPNCQQTLSCTLPTVTAFSSPAELCAPGTVTLSAIGANTYTWSVFSGAGTVSPTTGTPVTGTVPSTTTYQVQGCIGVGCCSNAQVIVSVSPGVNLYPGGSLSSFQDFETSGWACSNWTNLTAARPTVTGNYWILRNSQTATALQSCIFDWGSTPYNINVNQFGNNVLNGQYSLTCEGYASPGTVYYGYNDAVVSNSRAILTVNGTGYSGYTVTFNYQVGGDTLTGTYGAVDYSTDGGTTWVLLQKFQKVFTAATATVQLPSAIANIANLKIGFRLATPADNNNYAPTFTIDNLSVIAYPVPVTPGAPAAPTGLVVCPGNGSTLFTTSAGSTGYNWTISGASIGTTTITPNGDSATVYWDPTATGTAQICVQSVSSCGATSSISCSTVTLSTSWTWTGAVSTDWMDYRNWACGSVPNSNTSDAIIPNTVNKPHILLGEIVQIRNININAANALVTIDNGGVFQVAGTLTLAASAYIDNSAGTIEFNSSSAQTIPVGTFVGNNCYNIILDQSVTIAAGGFINLSGVLSMSVAQTFTTNNGLTLLSSAAGTAQVSAIPSGGAITGTVTVQRYYPAHRAWRLISVPAVSAQTVQQAFMEGTYNTAMSPWPASDNNPNPGYGTHISGNSPNANQFDVTRLNNPSMMTYVSGTPPNDVWAGIPNTNATSVNYKNGYMLFVRGSRAVNLPLDVSAPADPTILRPKGTLNIGTQAAVPVAANSFAVFGNPYASTIDFHALSRSNVIDAFNVWDPNAAGSFNVGAWVTFTWNGSTYVAAPASYTAGLGRYIQSSQAVLVQNSTGAAGTVIASESNKVSGSVTSPFTPMVQQEQFRTNIYQLNADGSTQLVDGTLTIYDNNYNAGVDNVDAWKPTNFSSETISQSNAGRSLGIEARPIIGNHDTLFYNISFYRRPYRFEFIATRLDHPGLRGYLHDNYLNTDTPLNLNDTTRVDFVTNNDLASRDNTRFQAIFTTDAPLPVTLRSIKAYKQNNGVQVEWTLSQEINMHHYEIEKSIEGTMFSMKGSQPSKGNSNTSVTYNWLDVNPNKGANFYRIKSFDRSGVYSYSSIVKVMLEGSPSIKVYPNPVIDGTINIEFTNVAKGTYQVRLVNNIGQVIMTQVLTHQEGSGSETVKPDKHVAHGNYELEVINTVDNNKFTTKLVY